MTILNIHIKDEDKKKLRDFIESQKKKSVSEYIRNILSEKMKVEEFALDSEKNVKIEIPNYIPKNVYVGFVNGAIIGVSDSPNKISQIAAEKFPNLPLKIKYNGPKKKQMEYCYVNLSILQCWKYAEIEEKSYPVIPIILKIKTIEKKFFSSIDTASSLCVLKNDIFSSDQLQINREEQISIAAGVFEFKIYLGKIKLGDIEFDMEFITAPIAETLPFSMLIGRNLLDQLDAYFFGKKQIVCLKIAE